MAVPLPHPGRAPGRAAPARRRITARGTPAARALAAGALVALVGLAGCSGSSDDASTTSGAAQAAGAPAPAAEAAGDAAGKDSQADTARVVAAAAPKLVRTAEVVLEVRDLRAAAARVRATAEALEGTVTSEVSSSGASVPRPSGVGTDAGAGVDAPPGDAGGRDATSVGPGRSILVVRVPEPQLGAALDRLSGPAGVGRELSRSASTRDVTGDLADLESRVASQRASVTRVRQLLDRAGSLSDVVLLEAELARREADLDALQARRTALADRAALATLTVDLRTAEAVQETEESSGLLAGLRSGWDAVGTSTRIVLTVVGALLPFAVLAALVGGPVLWLTRRRRRAARPVPASIGSGAPRTEQPVPVGVAAAGAGPSGDVDGGSRDRPGRAP